MTRAGIRAEGKRLLISLQEASCFFVINFRNSSSDRSTLAVACLKIKLQKLGALSVGAVKANFNSSHSHGFFLFGVSIPVIVWAYAILFLKLAVEITEVVIAAVDRDG